MDIKNYVKRNVLNFKSQVLDKTYATKDDLANIDVKSAYESAVDGGYTGTREEFEQALANIGEVELPSNVVSSKSDVQLRPTVIFSFDQPAIDSRATILEESGFRGVYAWRPTSTNPGTDAMLELCRRGHDFSVYGGEGSLLPWTSTKDEWKAYIKPCLDRMSAVGVKYPTMYSCSQQISTPELTEACKELGFKYIRCGTINNVDPIQYVNWQTNNPSYEYFFPWSFANRAFENMKDKIDTAITNNYRIIIFSHQLGTDGNPEEVFRQIVEYVKSKVDLGVLDVLTPKEYYDKYQREADYQKMLTSYLNADPTDIDFTEWEV